MVPLEPVLDFTTLGLPLELFPDRLAPKGELNNMNGQKLKSAAAALALVAGAALPAHAAVFVGTWDPAFGAPFNDLGWRGDVTVFVPDACLAQAGLVFNTAPCSGNAMQLVSAQVEFFNLANPLVTVETLSFASPTGGPGVTGMVITGGAVTGVVGEFNYLVDAFSSIAGGGAVDFGLGFVGNAAFMTWLNTSTFSGGTSDPDFPATVTFTPAIPEPSTWALMFAGLGLVGLSAARRRREPMA
jgi:hypothetical protein